MTFSEGNVSPIIQKKNNKNNKNYFKKIRRKDIFRTSYITHCGTFSYKSLRNLQSSFISIKRIAITALIRNQNTRNRPFEQSKKLKYRKGGMEYLAKTRLGK